MTKQQIMDYLEGYDNEEDVSINEMLRDMAEAERDRIEELEERQHQSGFYAFQDQMALWRYER